MPNTFTKFSVIYNNPFVFAPLLASFYLALTPKPKNVLLSYLVLPLVLYPSSRKTLYTSRPNSVSTIHTLFTRRDRKENTLRLESLIQEYKHLTNQALLYAIHNDALNLLEDLSVTITKPKWYANSLCHEESLRAAKKLGELFSKYDIPDCYILLGVRHI